MGNFKKTKHNVHAPSGGRIVNVALLRWFPSIASTPCPDAHWVKSRETDSKNSISLSRLFEKWAISSSVTSEGTNDLVNWSTASDRWDEGSGRAIATLIISTHSSNCFWRLGFVVFIIELSKLTILLWKLLFLNLKVSCVITRFLFSSYLRNIARNNA